MRKIIPFQVDACEVAMVRTALQIYRNALHAIATTANGGDIADLVDANIDSITELIERTRAYEAKPVEPRPMYVGTPCEFDTHGCVYACEHCGRRVYVDCDIHDPSMRRAQVVCPDCCNSITREKEGENR